MEYVPSSILGALHVAGVQPASEPRASRLNFSRKSNNDTPKAASKAWSGSMPPAISSQNLVNDMEPFCSTNCLTTMVSTSYWENQSSSSNPTWGHQKSSGCEINSRELTAIRLTYSAWPSLIKRISES